MGIIDNLKSKLKGNKVNPAPATAEKTETVRKPFDTGMRYDKVQQSDLNEIIRELYADLIDKRENEEKEKRAELQKTFTEQGMPEDKIKGNIQGEMHKERFSENGTAKAIDILLPLRVGDKKDIDIQYSVAHYCLEAGDSKYKKTDDECAYRVFAKYVEDVLYRPFVNINEIYYTGTETQETARSVLAEKSPKDILKQNLVPYENGTAEYKESKEDLADYYTQAQKIIAEIKSRVAEKEAKLGKNATSVIDEVDNLQGK
jgi:hypothetical protein